MSEERVTRRSLSFKMAIICIIILAVSVIGAIACYRIVVNDKNTTGNSNTSTPTETDPFAGEYFHSIHTDLAPGDQKEP